MNLLPRGGSIAAGHMRMPSEAICAGGVGGWVEQVTRERVVFVEVGVYVESSMSVVDIAGFVVAAVACRVVEIVAAKAAATWSDCRGSGVDMRRVRVCAVCLSAFT